MKCLMNIIFDLMCLYVPSLILNVNVIFQAEHPCGVLFVYLLFTSPASTGHPVFNVTLLWIVGNSLVCRNADLQKVFMKGEMSVMVSSDSGTALKCGGWDWAWDSLTSVVHRPRSSFCWFVRILRSSVSQAIFTSTVGAWETRNMISLPGTH